MTASTDTTVTTAIDPDVESLIRSVLDPSASESARWRTLVETGLARLGTPERLGGSAASMPEVAALLRAGGHAASPLPLAENDLLAGRLLGLAADDRLRTVGILDGQDTVRSLPVTGEVELVVVIRATPDGATRIAEIPLSECTRDDATNLAGEARPTVGLPAGWEERYDTGEGDRDLLRAVRLLVGWARATAASGAMDRVLELAALHATSRTQFGRPIGRFQAVQQLVADIAAKAALSRAVVEAAALRIGDADGSPLVGAVLAAEFEIAAACSVVGHAASTVVRNSHQVLGAMGTTREHDLHRYTTRLLAWRSDVSAVRDWDRLVLEHARSAGSAWSRIAPVATAGR